MPWQKRLGVLLEVLPHVAVVPLAAVAVLHAAVVDEEAVAEEGDCRLLIQDSTGKNISFAPHEMYLWFIHDMENLIRNLDLGGKGSITRPVCTIHG